VGVTKISKKSLKLNKEWFNQKDLIDAIEDTNNQTESMKVRYYLCLILIDFIKI
jgi:predicted XRE-type DNA-binding protein